MTKLSKISLILILAGYITLVSVVAAPTIIDIEKPMYIDITASDSTIIINSLKWIPDIDTKTFAAMELNITNTGLERELTISMAFWDGSKVQIAQGLKTQTVGNTTLLIEVPLTWAGSYTTDDIQDARIMIV